MNIKSDGVRVVDFPRGDFTPLEEEEIELDGNSGKFRLFTQAAKPLLEISTVYPVLAIRADPFHADRTG